MRFSAVIFPLFLLALSAGVEVQAQSADSVPTIQPTFTRVFAAEDFGILFPSLSPNGKWISFSGGNPESGHMSLWILPAEGGDPIQLTRGGWDNQPVWFPSGDKLVFRSDRPARGGDGGHYVMTLPIDPNSGNPTGPPRQVSIEKCFAWLDVSPDGEWIAFVGWTVGRKAILVVPAVGGQSRNLVEVNTSIPAWAPDGESLYYSADHFPPGEALLRVSLEGAKVDTAFTWPEHVRLLGTPESKYAFRVVSMRDDEDQIWEVATLDGQPLGRFELPPGMDFFSHSLTSGGELLTVREEMTASTEILSIDGGPAQRLSLNDGNSEVLGWTPDGQQLFLRTALDGEDMFFFASTAGASMRQIPLPDGTFRSLGPVLSKDGGHLLFAVPEGEARIPQLKVLDIAEGGSREVSRSSVPVVLEGVELSGRGTTWWRDDDDFLYVERHGGDFDLMASTPSGPYRLLRRFQGELPATVAVNEDWIAYEWGPMARRSVALARVGDSAPRMLMTFPGRLESITWSHDGRRLAFTAYRRLEGREPPVRPELMIMELDGAGNLMGEPTVLTTPDIAWWSPHWLPGGRGLLLVGGGNIWKVSLDPGVDPVPITDDVEGNVFWPHISPDGRYMAYETSTLRGSSLWRVGLGEALSGFRK
jgi:Tol biopolymer transport system component